MKDFLEKLSPLKYEAAFHAEAAEVQKVFDRQYQKLRKSITAPGFRKGKTPLSYVRANYFSEVQGRVLNALIEEGYAQTARKNNLNPAGPPRADVKLPHENQDFKFKLTIEVHPEVQAKDFENFHLKIKKQKDIGMEQADAVIENLKKEDKKNDYLALKGENLQRFKEEILEKLKSEVKMRRKEELRSQAFDQLLEKNPFELPESIILKHKHHLTAKTMQNLKAQGLSESQIQNWLKKNDSKIHEQSKKNARGVYLIQNLALKLNLNETKEETLQSLQKRGLGQKEIPQSSLEAFRWQRIYTKVLDYIVSQSKINETP